MNTAVLLSQPCRDGVRWACNELGVLVATGKMHAAPARDLYDLACGLGSRAACDNAKLLASGGAGFHHADPDLAEYGVLLRNGKGPLRERTVLAVYTRACDQGFPSGCGRLAGLYFQGSGVPADRARAAKLLSQACDAGHAQSCSNIGLMLKRGDGLPQDEVKAIQYLKKACALGLPSACRLLESNVP